MHIRKDTVTETTNVSDGGRFSIRLKFRTDSFPWFGTDRCRAVPRSVEISVIEHGQVMVREVLAFRKFFERIGPLEYRLRQELELPVAGLDVDMTRTRREVVSRSEP
jgi:hypothetical protein